ncbi:putative Zn(2)-C6 fungal-type domain-containing protein [Seiridium unicorne]|uniref:Zn(2)-C6 fungal-type domain-containing protein n=1 Tax=Seiridium unicorne TaxID=138068 RepID=A0ABR2UXF4_9PEZI
MQKARMSNVTKHNHIAPNVSGAEGTVKAMLSNQRSSYSANQLKFQGSCSRHILKIQLLLDPDSLNTWDATGMFYLQEFTSTIPQNAESSDPLQSAATGIGALNIWHRQAGRKSLYHIFVPSLSAATEDVHYFQTVAYYCRSLRRHHQQMCLQGKVFLSVPLLLFEMLRRNRKAALDHVNHGLALLLTLLMDGDTRRLVENFAPNPRPVLGAVADLFSHLATPPRYSSGKS